VTVGRLVGEVESYTPQSIAEYSIDASLNEGIKEGFDCYGPMGLRSLGNERNIIVGHNLHPLLKQLDEVRLIQADDMPLFLLG
jgi:hypothetical protein